MTERMTRGKRYLIAAGTARYDHLAEDLQLPSVPADLARIVACFTALGYARVLPELGEDPTADQMRQSLGEWFADKSRTELDHLVLYYSGHGESVEGAGHYLCGRDAQYKDDQLLWYSAFADEDIATALASSGVQHAMIIFDTCFSTGGVISLSKKAAEILESSKWNNDLPHGIHLIAASREREIAKEGVFSGNFCDALANRDARLGGALQEFLQPNAVVTAINAAFKKDKVRQRASYYLATPVSSDVVELLPNPGYEPGRPSGLTLDEHWLAKAQGGSLDLSAWYFTGRQSALTQLVVWLSAPAGDNKARVVTGSPGCGKSALLGRIVSLADPEQRTRAEAAGVLTGVPNETIPPSGCTDLAIHARGKTLTDIVGILASALKQPAGSGTEIVQHLKTRTELFTLVVDALDEAKESNRIATELLRPIASLPSVKLLVASRPDSTQPKPQQRFTGLGRATVEIDLDRPEYLGGDDLELYLTKRLLAADEPDRPTPYRNQPAVALSIAQGVARRSQGNFLIARLVADNLVNTVRAMTAAEAASFQFPAEVGDAFEQFLERLEHQGAMGKATAIDLLRPLAYAEGAGTPWGSIWPALASALADTEYLDHDIDLLRRHAGSFLVETLEQGQSVYRLFHEALAEHLRRSSYAEDQRKITTALVKLVEPRDDGNLAWLNAEPYLRVHLAAHASAGNVLGELLSDPLYLVAAERSRLLRALGQISSEAAAEFGRIYELASHHLHSADPGRRLAYLELAAVQNDAAELAQRLSEVNLPRPWRVVWANWSTFADHRVLANRSGAIAGLVNVEFGDTSLAIVASEFKEHLDGDLIPYSELIAYDVADGHQHFCTGHLSLVSICAIEKTALNGEAVIVAGTRKGQIRVWRTHDGVGLGEPLEVRRPGAEILFVDKLACATVEDSCLVAVGGRSALDVGSDALLDVWDLESRRPVLDAPIRLEGAEIRALALVPQEPFEVLISADTLGYVRLWDLNSSSVLDEMHVGERLKAMTVAFDGDSLRIVTGCGEQIMVWSAFEDGLKLAHEPRAGHAEGVTCLSVGTLGGESVILSGGRDNMVRIWRLDDSKELFATLVGFRGSGQPRAVALATLRQRSVLISADERGSVLAWRVGGRRALTKKPAEVPRCGLINDIVLVQTAGGPCVVTHDRHQEVRAWHAATGRPWDGPLGDTLQDRVSMTAGIIGKRFSIITCDRNGVMSLHEETGSPRVLGATEPGNVPAPRLSIAHWEDRDYLVVLDRANNVHVLDLGEDRVECRFSVGGADWSSRVCIVNSASGPLLVFFAMNQLFSIRHLLTGQFGRRGPSRKRGGMVVAAVATELGGRPLFLAADEEGCLRIWDLDRGQPLSGFSHYVEAGSYVKAVAFAESGGQPLVASADYRSVVRIWHGTAELSRIETDCTVTSLAFVPGHGLLVAGAEGMMLIAVPGI